MHRRLFLQALAYTLFCGVFSAAVAVAVLVLVTNLGLISWLSSFFILMFGSVYVTIKALDWICGKNDGLTS